MSIAFKEWAVVCEALGDGRQCVIIRRGGIAEGRKGFQFEHREFFLFPTWFHEQLEKTTLPPGAPIPDELAGEVEIRFAAALEWSRFVTDLDALQRLRQYHVLHDSVVEERFHAGEGDGVHVAFVRVFRVDPPCRLAMEKQYGGCRSWVDLPDLDGSVLVSVLTDEEHDRRRREIEAALAQG